MHFRLDLFIEANNMNPNQTAPLELGLYFLQYRLPKNVCRHEETTKVVTGRLTTIMTAVDDGMQSAVAHLVER